MKDFIIDFLGIFLLIFISIFLLISTVVYLGNQIMPTLRAESIRFIRDVYLAVEDKK
jgi:hypothetical protein